MILSLAVASPVALAQSQKVPATQGAQSQQAQDRTDFSSPEKAMVVVYARPGFWDMAAIIYDHKVDGETAKNDLRELSRLAGWEPDGLVIRNDQSPNAGPVMTSLEFNARVLKPQTHDLPLEAIALAFRRFDRVGAVFMTGPGYPYWGPMNYRTPKAAMQGVINGGAFTFHLAIKDPSLDSFKYPLTDPAAPKPVEKTATDNRAVWRRLIIALVLAITLALIAYGAAAWRQQRSAMERDDAA